MLAMEELQDSAQQAASDVKCQASLRVLQADFGLN